MEVFIFKTDQNFVFKSFPFKSKIFAPSHHSQIAISSLSPLSIIFTAIIQILCALAYVQGGEKGITDGSYLKITAVPQAMNEDVL